MRYASLAAVVLLAVASTTQAAVVATMQEVGNDIVVVGGGTINLTDLTLQNTGTVNVGMNPSGPSIGFGANPSTFLTVDLYSSITPPSAFGAGIGLLATTGTGDRFVVLPTSLLVP